MALKFDNYLQFFENSRDSIYRFDRHVTAEPWPAIYTSICNHNCKHCKPSSIRSDGSYIPVQITYSTA